MPAGGLIGTFTLVLVLAFNRAIASIATPPDETFLVYAQSANPNVKLLRIVTEFPGSFPVSMMRSTDLSMVFVQNDSTTVVAASRPRIAQATLDSIAEWLVPFNPMSVDTFAIAMRILPLRQAIRAKSKLLSSPYSRLVSTTPWFRKGVSKSDTLGGKKHPWVNDFAGSFQEPTYSADTLGSYVIYPTAAQGRGIKGSVVVTARVNTDGFVDDVVILESNNDLFDLAAARAVKCLRFKPGIYRGVTTTMWVTIPIEFSPK